jgi:hypothetical protein
MWAGIRVTDLGLGATLWSMWQRLRDRARRVCERPTTALPLAIVNTSSGGDGGHILSDASVSPLQLQVLMPLAAHPSAWDVHQPRLVDLSKVGLALAQRPGAEAARRYAEAGWKVTVLTAGAEETISLDGADLDRVDVGATSSLGQAILLALDAMHRIPDRLVVYLPDTYLGDPMPNGQHDTMVYVETSDPEPWTTFEVDHQDRIVSVYPPRSDKSHRMLHRAFIGVFTFCQPDEFTEVLRRSLSQDLRDGVDPFYRAVSTYSNALPAEQRILQLAQYWGLGHLVSA